MSEELKPCPFCGVKLMWDSDDEYTEHEKNECILSGDKFHIEHFGYDEQEFIKAWNTRAPSEKPTSEDVQEALDYIDQYRVSFFVPATVKHYHTIKAALEQLGGE